MPHDQPWLDDYQTSVKKKLQEKWAEDHNIFEIQNRALRAAINCPFPIRTPETCAGCGEAACINAWKGQEELWGKSEGGQLPVSAVNIVNTNPVPRSSNALDGKTDSTKSLLHGRLVSGLETRDLFNYLINEIEEDKAA